MTNSSPAALSPKGSSLAGVTEDFRRGVYFQVNRDPGAQMMPSELPASELCHPPCWLYSQAGWSHAVARWPSAPGLHLQELGRGTAPLCGSTRGKGPGIQRPGPPSWSLRPFLADHGVGVGPGQCCVLTGRVWVTCSASGGGGGVGSNPTSRD